MCLFVSGTARDCIEEKKAVMHETVGVDIS